MTFHSQGCESEVGPAFAQSPGPTHPSAATSSQQRLALHCEKLLRADKKCTIVQYGELQTGSLSARAGATSLSVNIDDHSMALQATASHLLAAMEGFDAFFTW